MSKITNVLMVGVGGQGIVLASDIISRAALYAGHDVKKSEIHGMSQRGGSVFSHIRFGEKVYSPVIPEGEADILLSLEEMETLRWLSYINSDTRVIVTKTRINPPNVTNYPDNIDQEIKKHFKNSWVIEPSRISEKTGDAKFVNTALLGLISTCLDFSDEAWRRSIHENVPDGTFEANMTAFAAGKTLMKNGS
jgi:indolepyruvate ferredoxin oxidoreductase beta subunit